MTPHTNKQEPAVASRPVRGRMSSQDNQNNPYLNATATTTNTAEDRSKSAGITRPRLSKTDYLIQKMEDKNKLARDLDSPVAKTKDLQGGGIA
jgi:hypothetical protein